MNTKIKQKFFIFFLISLLIGIVSGCNNDKEELPEPPPEPLPEVLVPCNYDPEDREVIEIKDFRTKLYYQVPWPEGVVHPGCADNPNGIVCNMFTPVYDFYEPSASGGNYIKISFCNFPEYVQNWNQKNKELNVRKCICIEGEIDVLVSGKLYVSYKSESELYGEMELTSLLKITP